MVRGWLCRVKGREISKSMQLGFCFLDCPGQGAFQETGSAGEGQVRGTSVARHGWVQWPGDQRLVRTGTGAGRAEAERLCPSTPCDVTTGG